MKILLITPGSGDDFYCENCLRDGGLIREMRVLGHDMSIVPLYLPLRTEQAARGAESPIFFGGVNVYLQQKWRLFRWTPRWLDSLFDARWLLRKLSRRSSMTDAAFLGEMTVSMLRGARGRQKKELSRLVNWLARGEKPDLVCLSNALLAGLVPRIKAELNVPVACILQDEDGFLDTLGEPFSRDAWGLLKRRCEQIDAFLPVSDYFAGVMTERLELPRQKVHVVRTGIDTSGYSPPTAAPNPPAIGFLSQMCHAKGLDLLAEAFVLLKVCPEHRNLKLRIAGGATADDREYVAGVLNRLAGAGVDGDVDVQYHLDSATKVSFLQSLSVISVPTRQGESFGQFALEAMACGVPAVLPAHGGFVEIIEATGGGLLCEPNSPASLAEALGDVLTDADRAAKLGERGRESVCRDFTIEKMASRAAEVFETAIIGA